MKVGWFGYKYNYSYTYYIYRVKCLFSSFFLGNSVTNHDARPKVQFGKLENKIHTFQEAHILLNNLLPFRDNFWKFNVFEVAAIHPAVREHHVLLRASMNSFNTH